MPRPFAVSLGLVAVLGGLACAWPSLVQAGPGCGGTVRSLGGRPLAGAQVSLLQPGPAGRVAVVERAFSDADGGFSFAHAPTPAGELLVEVSAPDHEPLRVPAGEPRFELELRALAAIDGQVLAADGAHGGNVAGVRLFATDVDDPQRCYEGRSRWDGTFCLRVPHGRSYVVGGTAADGTTVQVARGVEAGALNCELQLAK